MCRCRLEGHPRRYGLAMGGPTINVEELRRALDRVLDAVELQMGSAVDLDAAHYWMLAPKAAFGLVPDPELHIMAGQLTDDVEEIGEPLQRDPGDGVFIWHDLEHLCGVLMRVASLDLPSDG